MARGTQRPEKKRMVAPTGAEAGRLEEDRRREKYWKRWGPYLSERQWGTVREDYSPYGTAWDYLPHDHARSRAYRWGEDGLGGICDRHQYICFALALWNGKDPILKERLFGLTGSEGNHGEDVKEYYFYLDSTPTHSYMKFLYKYPQAEFPYGLLAQENRQRGKRDLEFELINTGVFDDNRYFDVFIEYAKAGADDILVRIEAINRGPEPAELHLLPTLWFRNTWSWGLDERKPRLRRDDSVEIATIKADHYYYGSRWLYCEGSPQLLFTENETNKSKLFNSENESPYVKDGINDYIVHGVKAAVNSAASGTKGSAHYRATLAPGASFSTWLRLTNVSPSSGQPLDGNFQRTLHDRRTEADEFYRTVIPDPIAPDHKNVMRQALAGVLWSKQFYHYDLNRWIKGDPAGPEPPRERLNGRNHEWCHLYNADVISMPDKWEYPWYAAWDLAFHCIALALVDSDFAKEQLVLMTREWYMHPNGQLPAYEWAFGDVNPPVHAWAAWRVYKVEKKRRGKGDRRFLERVFQKLLLNFTWWVNRKDAEGRNVFQGGFLGLDNIGVFDRSAPLPTGGHIEQSDGTSWMGMYCLNILAVALELARENSAYEDVASKFFEHFVYICRAMNDIGDEGIELWDVADGFYYDVLHLPDGKALARRPGAAVLGAGHRARAPRAPAQVRAAHALVSRQSSRSLPAGDAPGDRRRLAPAALARRRRSAHARAAHDARRARVPLAARHPRALAPPRRAPVRAARGGARASGRLRAGGVLQRPVRRQLELARSDLVSDELPARRSAAALRSLLPRRAEGGIPDGLGADDDALGGGRRAVAPADTDLPARRAGPATGPRGRRALRHRPALARPGPLPRVLPR